MTDEYAEREVQIITPFDFHKNFLHPENLMIQFAANVKAKPYDIGSMCFVKREEVLPGWDAGKVVKPRKVVLHSLQKERRALIIKILDELYNSGNRDSSFWTKLRNLQRFIDWADINECSNFLVNKQYSVEAYRKYTDYLYHQILESGRMNAESARGLQAGVHYFFDVYYPDSATELKATVNIIEFSRQNNQAPEEEQVERYLSTMVPIARNLRTAIMNDDFPLIIDCGEHEAIILPCNARGLYSPFSGQLHSMFNIVEKRYFTEDEFLKHMVEECEKKGVTTQFPTWKKDHKKTMSLIDDSNYDKTNSYYRCIWAQKVIRIYAKLIQMLTGANSSDLTRLEYNNALNVVSDGVKKELVTVKFRASGLEVHYPVHRKGVKLLKEYIEFREWYLDGRKTSYLFFTDIASSGSRVEPLPLRADFDSRLFKQLSGRMIDPTIKNITPTKARKFKSVM